MIYQFRPMDRWPHASTKSRRPKGTFRAGWQQTVDLLSDELEKLAARSVVLQVNCDRADIRLDGMFRAINGAIAILLKTGGS